MRGTLDPVAMTDSPIFDFESDFAGALYCIPMSVRLKLDNVGVKVSLKQWNKLARDERDQLLIRPCNAPADRRAYRDYLVAAIEARTGDKASELAVAEHPEWLDDSRIPVQVSEYFAAESRSPLTLPQWTGLAPLQRYVLIKLTRPGHRNENFLPALREFGLSN
jgi:hypothetical protein